MPEPPPDAAARRRAAARAGHDADEAEARSRLSDPEPPVRATALRALARMGALRADDLETPARDADPGVRRSVAEVAGATPDVEGAATTVEHLLTDPEPLVVEAAAWACGEQRAPTPGTVDALAGVARDHPDVLCREAAVAALGALGDEAGLPAILDALADKATVRRRAVIALAPFDGEAVDDALRRHLDDRDVQVRQAAEDLLGRGAERDEGLGRGRGAERDEGGAAAPPS